MRITATLTSHNRRQKTVRCLRSYFAQSVPGGAILDAVLVDDGSSDGTRETVETEFTDVTVIQGDGTLFWAGGMALAEREALRDAPTHLLWLNDDVTLHPRALRRLLETLGAGEPPRIAVGALADPDTGALTYSGVARTNWHPLRTQLVAPAPEGEGPIEVETFNGNVVLVPVDVAHRVGPIDAGFGHAAADFDYGQRARNAGVRNMLASGVVGLCPPNLGPAPWCDPGLRFKERLGVLLGPKGHPPRARARYLRRYGGALWPLYWSLPYIRAAPALALAPMRRTRAHDR